MSLSWGLIAALITVGCLEINGMTRDKRCRYVSSSILMKFWKSSGNALISSNRFVCDSISLFSNQSLDHMRRCFLFFFFKMTKIAKLSRSRSVLSAMLQTRVCEDSLRLVCKSIECVAREAQPPSGCLPVDRCV